MTHESNFVSAEPLRKPSTGVDGKNGVSGKALAAILLLATAVLSWASYERWSGPILIWLGGDGAEASVKSMQRTAEQKMLIDVTQGELSEIVVTGEKAQAANAALPFSNQPISVAPTFHLLGATPANALRAQTCLTQAIYYEAGFESLAGKRAVAQVVLNRMKHPAFPSSVCGVVYQGYRDRICQFSFTCDGALFRKPQRAAWAESESVAAAALAGHVEPEVGTATHYHADYVSPYWAPKLSKIAKLGAHIFYAWPGTWGRRSAFSSRYSGIEYLPSLQQIRLPADTINETSAIDFAKTGLSVAPSVTDRHAKTDVGGRLDVSKGWTLRIPGPSETRSRYAELASDQMGSTPTSESIAEAGGQ